MHGAKTVPRKSATRKTPSKTIDIPLISKSKVALKKAVR